MLFMQSVVVVGVEGQVKFALPQVVGFLPIPQPGQLQTEGRAGLVPQEDQLEGAVPGLLFPHGGEIQRLLVEGETALQVQNVEVEVIEGCHAVHSFNVFFCPPTRVSVWNR